MTATRADACVTACADTFRDDGEILVSPMGTIPRIGALLAKATFAPDLLISDGEAYLLDGAPPLGAESGAVIEGWMPFRLVFDVVASGRRHVMMGASQLDRHGNQNISAVGNWKTPKVQLLGSRGAPGNTANHRTSYWVSQHSSRVFVDAVDFVSGVGPSRAAEHREAARFNNIHRIVTNLAVLDLGGELDTMRLLSVHPGVDIAEVVEATGFDLDTAGAGEARSPTSEELDLIAQLDPAGRRFQEVPRA